MTAVPEDSELAQGVHDDDPQPCILFLDSLNCHSKAEVTSQIRRYVVVLNSPTAPR